MGVRIWYLCGKPDQITLMELQPHAHSCPMGGGALCEPRLSKGHEQCNGTNIAIMTYIESIFFGGDQAAIMERSTQQIFKKRLEMCYLDSLSLLVLEKKTQDSYYKQDKNKIYDIRFINSSSIRNI